MSTEGRFYEKYASLIGEGEDLTMAGDRSLLYGTEPPEDHWRVDHFLAARAKRKGIRAGIKVAVVFALKSLDEETAREVQDLLEKKELVR